MLRVVPLLLLCVTSVTAEERRVYGKTLVAELATKNQKTVLEITKVEDIAVQTSFPLEGKALVIVDGEFSKDNKLLGIILKSEKSTMVVLYDIPKGKRLWARDEPGAINIYLHADHIVMHIEGVRFEKLNLADGKTIGK